MESTGKPMKIHVSENTYLQTKNNYSFTEPKGIEVKGKGLMNNGWGLGIAYEHGIMNFASDKGTFAHVSLKPDLQHDWITSVGLGLNRV